MEIGANWQDDCKRSDLFYLHTNTRGSDSEPFIETQTETHIEAHTEIHTPNLSLGRKQLTGKNFLKTNVDFTKFYKKRSASKNNVYSAEHEIELTLAFKSTTRATGVAWCVAC